MSPTLIFWAAFAQVALTIVVVIMMRKARSASRRSRGMTLDDIAMNRPEDWNEQATKLSNNLKNQFEMPVLFFAAIGFALALKLADPVLTALAWVFVLTRVIQTAIHIGPNKVLPRALAYIAGVAALVAMWIDLAVHVALS